MFRSPDNQVFVFLTIPWFTKSVTSWWVLVHEHNAYDDVIDFEKARYLENETFFLQIRFIN